MRTEVEQYLKFIYEDGSAEIILDAFFPAPVRQLDRLLKLSEEDPDPEDIRRQMQDFCREKRESLQKKLPELRALARGSGISARAAAQVLKKTSEEIRKRREAREMILGPAAKKKADEQLKVWTDLYDSQKRTLRSAKDYASACDGSVRKAARDIDALANNEERIKSWGTRKK